MMLVKQYLYGRFFRQFYVKDEKKKALYRMLRDMLEKKIITRVFRV